LLFAGDWAIINFSNEIRKIIWFKRLLGK